MYVRLAFSVAAHLEPEILIVDEVLAVGDAQFQQKCIGRMQDVGREGRTVVFVSHNMAAIQSLCSKGMLLSHGRMIGFGAIGDQVQEYLASMQNAVESGDGQQINMRSGIQVKSLRMEPNPVVSGCPVKFVLELGCASPMRLDAITILINTFNRSLAGVVDLRRVQGYRFNGDDSLVIRGEIRAMPLVEGAYGIGIYVRTQNQEETVGNVTTLDILSKATQGQIAPYPPEVRGVVELDATFAVANGH